VPLDRQAARVRTQDDARTFKIELSEVHKVPFGDGYDKVDWVVINGTWHKRVSAHYITGNCAKYIPDPNANGAVGF
jgi:hypothetical protein